MKNLTELKSWQALQQHHADIAHTHMRDWFDMDESRFSKMTLSVDDILLDYSRNRITQETLDLLIRLADAAELPQKIAGLFKGEPMNATEKRPALHTALRDLSHTPIFIQAENIAQKIQIAYQKMEAFCAQIHQQQWRGITNKPIQHIVNIGIGGSYLGPKMCTFALKSAAVSNLKFHFISSVDKAHLEEITAELDPETTLFIISSKSFTTLETITNAQTIYAWMHAKFGATVLQKHFIAITAESEKARAFGIPSENIFPLWEWVGGRYSIWSAIGLPLMLMIGPAQFEHFLAGAYQMDQHFRQAPFAKNMPVLLGLLDIWYTNFFNSHVKAIVPYAHRLRYLIPYLQQAEMESNGKNINMQGEAIHYATSSVIFGEEGCNGQHAYHQLLHQGQHLVPVDFILIGEPSLDKHQDILIASGLSQAQALMRGKTYEEALAALLAQNLTIEEAERLAQHQVVPGNRPSNILFLRSLNPRSLGALIALYEHKIFVQGVIWQINSFDQWGVELGKQLLPAILRSVQGASDQDLDSATSGLIQHFKNI